MSTGNPEVAAAMPAMVGTALHWVLRTLGIEISAVEGLLGTSPPCGTLPPYLVTSGERAPFVDPLAAGSISGIRLTSHRDDLVRAVRGPGLHRAALLRAAGRSGRIVVTGGGSKSSNWDGAGVASPCSRCPAAPHGARAVLAGAHARGDDLDVEHSDQPGEGVVELNDANRALKFAFTR